ncbi:MAG: hypothetical protein JO269_04035 [Burkholderiaceae bacterium]|nr:hypothetical protein [Burkholderiaceae bacterium]
MKKSILTVDDSRSFRQMVTLNLESAGYRVTGAVAAPAASSLEKGESREQF